MAADGRYVRVKRRFWTDEKSGLVSANLKLLLFYLITTPHGNMLGLYRLPDEYGARDIGWSLEEYRENFAQAVALGFVEHDPETSTVFVRNYLKHNPLENGNQVTGALKCLEELPTSPLFRSLADTVTALGKQYLEPLRKRLLERLAEPYGDPGHRISDQDQDLSQIDQSRQIDPATIPDEAAGERIASADVNTSQDQEPQEPAWTPCYRRSDWWNRFRKAFEEASGKPAAHEESESLAEVLKSDFCTRAYKRHACNVPADCEGFLNRRVLARLKKARARDGPLDNPVGLFRTILREEADSCGYRPGSA